MDAGTLYRDLCREKEEKYRKGIYGHTQRMLAYNSNKIEGSMLTEEQTASLFDEGVLTVSDSYYRAKDVEEMNGHFLMFNQMLVTFDEPLTHELIKAFHFELKSGVFEDRANGYAIGDYKKRANLIGTYQTTLPAAVFREMDALLSWYAAEEKTLETIAAFYARYEAIHPFQDGNGRTGRILIFRECLKHDIFPLIIEDKNRKQYIEALQEYRREQSVAGLCTLFAQEQAHYMEECRYFYENDLT